MANRDDVRCPICGAWSLLTGYSKMSTKEVWRHRCGNEHKFTIESPLKNLGMPPKKKPAKASFNTPQAAAKARKKLREQE